MKADSKVKDVGCHDDTIRKPTAVRMYNNGEHNPPHFHAYYQGSQATFDMEGNLIEGEMPNSKKKLISAWAEIHKDELIANWELAMNEEPLYRIEPLK